MVGIWAERSYHDLGIYMITQVDNSMQDEGVLSSRNHFLGTGSIVRRLKTN
jgi:hypothetical protein